MKKINFKFSEEFKAILNKARDYSISSLQQKISLESVLYFIIKAYLYAKKEDVESEVIFKMIDRLGMDSRVALERDCFSAMKRETKTLSIPADLYDSNPVFSDELIEVCERANASSRIEGMMKDEEDIIITTEDVLTSILARSYCDIVGILKNKYKITVDELIEYRVSKFGEDIRKSDLGKLEEKRLTAEDDRWQRTGRRKIEDEEEFQRAGDNQAINSKKVDPNSKTPALDSFAINMTKKALDGEYDPVIGRDKEIDQIIEILCCRKKNNAILLGDPGCGKTSIIELLAQRIASKEIHPDLRDKRIFSLDLNALLSGTTYRGQYEERLQHIIKEVTSDKNIIIFIDEIHNLIGNGSSSGSGDAANILKPYLARGEFQCIGSTTIDEYRKIIEKDGALKRRFNPIFISEPNVEETIKIITGLTNTYSKFHHVNYTPEVIAKCVEWSGKYINDRYFPDKAIGVLDMASSIAKLKCNIDTSEVDNVTAQITELRKQISIYIKEGKFEEGQKLRNAVKDLEKELEDKKQKLEQTKQDQSPEVSLEDVCSVISKISNVPVDKIMSSDITKIKEMHDELLKHIIGQDEAVKEITLALQRNILGLRDPNKPICSMMFVGATGVGKTLIAKLVAKHFMGSEKNLETIACSEYMQEWAESKLLGSAPGYVGYSDSEPRLYVLKRKPYCVLLIDEVEKSSKNLYNIWLNMLEEGEITLSTGEKVSCRNTIIIFTGNVGTKKLELRGNGIGFEKLTGMDKRNSDVNTVMSEVEKEFRPEFLNRLSKVVVFNSLGIDELNKIFYLELEKLQQRLMNEKHYTLNVSEQVRNFITAKCEPKYGARSLQRLIVKHIEEEICNAMLEQDITGKQNISVNLKEEKIRVNFE